MIALQKCLVTSFKFDMDQKCSDFGKWFQQRSNLRDFIFIFLSNFKVSEIISGEFFLLNVKLNWSEKLISKRMYQNQQGGIFAPPSTVRLNIWAKNAQNLESDFGKLQNWELFLI